MGAIVVAHADGLGGATVLTGDPRYLRRLATRTTNTVRIATGRPVQPGSSGGEGGGELVPEGGGRQDAHSYVQHLVPPAVVQA